MKKKRPSLSKERLPSRKPPELLPRGLLGKLLKPRRKRRDKRKERPRLRREERRARNQRESTSLKNQNLAKRARKVEKTRRTRSKVVSFFRSRPSTLLTEPMSPNQLKFPSDMLILILKKMKTLLLIMNI